MERYLKLIFERWSAELNKQQTNIINLYFYLVRISKKVSPSLPGEPLPFYYPTVFWQTISLTLMLFSFSLFYIFKPFFNPCVFIFLAKGMLKLKSDLIN